MNTLTGMEKFSRLEDKVYLTIEVVRKLREDKNRVEQEFDEMKQQVASALAEKTAAEEKLVALLNERDSILLKVEAMLDAISVIDADVAAAVGK